MFLTEDGEDSGISVLFFFFFRDTQTRLVSSSFDFQLVTKDVPLEAEWRLMQNVSSPDEWVPNSTSVFSVSAL